MCLWKNRPKCSPIHFANITKVIHTLEKVTQKCRRIFSFLITAQSKQLPIWRKFAKSGHPGFNACLKSLNSAPPRPHPPAPSKGLFHWFKCPWEGNKFCDMAEAQISTGWIVEYNVVVSLQGDQMSLWESRPKCSPTHFLSKVIHFLNRGGSSTKVLDTSRT
jgi:hypothetical protein